MSSNGKLSSLSFFWLHLKYCGEKNNVNIKFAYILENVAKYVCKNVCIQLVKLLENGKWYANCSESQFNEALKGYILQ